MLRSAESTLKRPRVVFGPEPRRIPDPIRIPGAHLGLGLCPGSLQLLLFSLALGVWSSGVLGLGRVRVFLYGLGRLLPEGPKASGQVRVIVASAVTCAIVIHLSQR